MPIYYGEAKFDGIRALRIYYVDGPSLSTVTDLTVNQVRQKVSRAPSCACKTTESFRMF